MFFKIIKKKEKRKKDMSSILSQYKIMRKLGRGGFG